MDLDKFMSATNGQRNAMLRAERKAAEQAATPQPTSMQQSAVTEPVTDEQIDALDTFALHAMAPLGRQSVRKFARALESFLASRAKGVKP
jgi:hypothetical protein